MSLLYSILKEHKVTYQYISVSMSNALPYVQILPQNISRNKRFYIYIFLYAFMETSEVISWLQLYYKFHEWHALPLSKWYAKCLIVLTSTFSVVRCITELWTKVSRAMDNCHVTSHVQFLSPQKYVTSPPNYCQQVICLHH